MHDNSYNARSEQRTEVHGAERIRVYLAARNIKLPGKENCVMGYKSTYDVERAERELVQRL